MHKVRFLQQQQKKNTLKVAGYHIINISIPRNKALQKQPILFKNIFV